MRTHRVGSHTPEESRRSSDLGHRVEGLILAAVALLALMAGLTRAPWAATVRPWLAMIAGLLLLIALVPHAPAVGLAEDLARSPAAPAHDHRRGRVALSHPPVVNTFLRAGFPEGETAPLELPPRVRAPADAAACARPCRRYTLCPWGGTRSLGDLHPRRGDHRAVAWRTCLFPRRSPWTMGRQGAIVSKRILEPNTTLYPVPVVLITTGADTPNVMTCNRAVSCSAEPPRMAVSVRPARHSHAMIRQCGEFVVNIPTPAQSSLCDYLGVVSGRDEDKIGMAGLSLTPALKVRTPLLADCPVNVECTVESAIDLGSHTLFIGLVQTVHAEEALLDGQGDVDVARAIGLTYACGTVRERPTYNFRAEDLRRAARGG